MKSRFGTPGQFMDALHNGDTHAQRELHHMHYRPLRYFAIKLLNDEDDAEDIVSITFEKFFKEVEKLETPQKVKSWLYITTRNACFTKLKAISRETRDRLGVAYVSNEMDDSSEQWMIRSESLKIAAELLKGLSPQRRKMIEMHFYEGLTIREIAEQLNLERNTVKNTIHKSLQLMREEALKRGLPAIVWTIIFLN